jgi:hypothetical protein
MTLYVYCLKHVSKLKYCDSTCEQHRLVLQHYVLLTTPMLQLLSEITTCILLALQLLLLAGLPLLLLLLLPLMSSSKCGQLLIVANTDTAAVNTLVHHCY